MNTLADVALIEHAPHGVGQIGELIEACSHALDTLRREQQAVEQTLGCTRGARGVHIDGVRLENLVGTLAKRGGHGAHRGAAGLVGGKSQ